MICRVWRGSTIPENASLYDDYLQKELFPKLQRELSSAGYLGYQLLSQERPGEVVFVTMLYFESLEQVRAFAGPDYETPVISSKARSLLSRFADRAVHYRVSGFQPPAVVR